MATMSSTLTLREFDLTKANSNHNFGPADMRSEHFIYKKAQKNTRPTLNNKKGQDRLIDLSLGDTAQAIDYDLTHIEYSVGALNPADIKRYHNLEAYPHAFESDKDVLSWLTAMMSESPFGHRLLQHLEQENWLICLAELESGAYALDQENKTLELDNFGLDAASIGRSTLFRNTILLNFARAMRDVWHETHSYEHHKIYKPAMAMLLERVRVADIDSVAVFIAWELRSAGYKEAWRHLLGTEDGDMAQVLLNISESYPTSVFNGIALAHIFRQWYADSMRIDAVDHMFLEDLDDYIAQESAEIGSKMPDHKIMQQMALIDDETSYLKEVSETILRDPFFSKMEDPINQAHLSQIIYDAKVVVCEGVPFRDSTLAQKIFPDS